MRLILTFCIAYAAWKHSVQIHAVAVLSNHFHMVCTDVEGRLPHFMHWLNLHVVGSSAPPAPSGPWRGHRVDL